MMCHVPRGRAAAKAGAGGAYLVADVFKEDVICHREVPDIVLVCGQANLLCTSGKLFT